MILIEFAKQRGLNPKWVAGTAGGEYHSECPICGGTDRFFMQPHKQQPKCLGYYKCRQCGTSGDSIQFARDFLDYTYEEALLAVGGTLTPRKPLFSMLNIKHESTVPSLKAPPQQWITHATSFAEKAQALLLKQSKILAYLEERAITQAVVQQYGLGWSPVDQYLVRATWGLDVQRQENGQLRPLWIPKGIVIPTFEPSGIVVRLKIRRTDWHPHDSLPKYAAISGSMNGLTLLGAQTKVLIVVESELDAYITHYAVGDFASVIASGGSAKYIDVVADQRAKNAACLLICHDNDEAGKKMLQKWQGLYPHAKGYPTPISKDIGEAIQEGGLVIREWIIDGLPQELKTTLGICNTTHTQEQL
jgi:DNA primase